VSGDDGGSGEEEGVAGIKLLVSQEDIVDIVRINKAGNEVAQDLEKMLDSLGIVDIHVDEIVSAD